MAAGTAAAAAAAAEAAKEEAAARAAQEAARQLACGEGLGYVVKSSFQPYAFQYVQWLLKLAEAL